MSHHNFFEQATFDELMLKTNAKTIYKIFKSRDFHFHGTIMALFASKPIIFTEYIIFPGKESRTVCSATVCHTDIFLKNYTYGNLYINDELKRTTGSTASGFQEQSTEN